MKKRMMKKRMMKKKDDEKKEEESDEEVYEPPTREFAMYRSDGRITDEGVENLMKDLKFNKTVEHLILEHNQITGEGAKILANHLQAKTLDNIKSMYDQITNKGAKVLLDGLKLHSTLQQLDLDNCRIGNEGAKALAEMLKNNSTLECLFLTNNQIDDEGGLAFLDGLRTNTKLNHLGLMANKVTDKFAIELLDLLEPYKEVQHNVEQNDDVEEKDFCVKYKFNEVTEVTKDSIADKAGVLPGWKIHKVNGVQMYEYKKPWTPDDEEDFLPFEHKVKEKRKKAEKKEQEAKELKEKIEVAKQKALDESQKLIDETIHKLRVVDKISFEINYEKHPINKTMQTFDLRYSEITEEYREKLRSYFNPRIKDAYICAFDDQRVTTLPEEVFSRHYKPEVKEPESPNLSDIEYKNEFEFDREALMNDEDSDSDWMPLVPYWLIPQDYYKDY